MTGLLVSVRNGEEARIALAGGADLIDVKEPRRGSLGAAEPVVWEAVRRQIDGQAPISAALGELATDNVEHHAPHCLGYAYAKMGLAGCASQTDWQERWLRAADRLPAGTAGVAVIYADWQTADAPAPDDVLDLAIRARCPLVLVDTHDKRGKTLLDWMDMPQINTLRQTTEQLGMGLVLAGALRLESIGPLRIAAPAYFAVRGAVCAGERTGGIELSLVKRLAQFVRKTEDAASSANA
jgi:uncharacterized protein (UPF0264 family)